MRRATVTMAWRWNESAIAAKLELTDNCALPPPWLRWERQQTRPEAGELYRVLRPRGGPQWNRRRAAVPSGSAALVRYAYGRYPKGPGVMPHAWRFAPLRFRPYIFQSLPYAIHVDVHVCRYSNHESNTAHAYISIYST